MACENLDANFIPVIYGELHDSIWQWYFPNNFCHAKFLDRQNESTACTLIALLLAEHIEENEKSFELTEILNPKLVNALANCILDGNQLLSMVSEKYNMKKNGKCYFNVINGMKLCNVSFKELKVFHQRLRKTVYECFKFDLIQAIDMWNLLNSEQLVRSRRKWPNLYVMLIAFKYCFLIIYQPSENVLALIDTHSHRVDRGAVIAAVDINCIDEFYEWIFDNIFPHHATRSASTYEMSLLYKKTSLTEHFRWKYSN